MYLATYMYTTYQYRDILKMYSRMSLTTSSNIL